MVFRSSMSTADMHTSSERFDVLPASCATAQVQQLLQAEADSARVSSARNSPTPLAPSPVPSTASMPSPKVSAVATQVTEAEAPRFHVGRMLGNGAFARVWQAYDAQRKETVALKALVRPSPTDARSRREMHEYRMTKGLEHPNIVRTFECIVEEQQILLVQELCPCGDLFDLIQPGIGATVRLMNSVLNQLAGALEFLLSVGIVHCDIKPENIVLDASGNAKLCDFGLAERVGTMMRGGPGTGSYMAPEIIHRRIFANREHPIEHSLDMWSLGVLFFTMLSGTKPWVSSDQVSDKYYHAYRTGAHVTALPWSLFTPQMHTIFGRLFTANPSARCSLAEFQAFLTNEWSDCIPAFVHEYTLARQGVSSTPSPKRKLSPRPFRVDAV